MYAMSDLQKRNPADLRKALLRRSNQECDRFEAAWKAGQRPRIEDHLAAVPEPERPELLRELILLEIDYRRSAGDPPQAEELLARFPGLDPTWLAGALSGAPTLPTTVSPAPPAGEPEDPLLDRRIGPYLIEQRVGSGGMGSVYKALRQDAYRQQVALKVIRPGLDGEEILRRFRTERQVLAELQHPHIARLLDGGATDDGRPYFVMEYIDGEPLDRYCERRRLGTRERLELFRTVCEAVQHAHQRQVLHRDLKPGNILVTADGTPKVTDFGLAKRLAGSPAPLAGADQTPSGAILGTPSYMAPEQAGGKRGEVGAAADVYALGAILYELLTGRPPFRAETPLDTLLQVLEGNPVPPRRLQPKLARDLETVCLKCLQKESGQRYPSVAALADDVRRFLEGDPVWARRVGRFERLWRWCRRKPALTAAAVLALLGLGIAGFFARQAHLTEEQRRAEKRQYAEEKALLAAMSGNADEAEKAIGEAVLLGSSPGQMCLLRGQVAFHKGDLEVARDHLEQAVNLMPDSVAARAMLALAYMHSGLHARWEQACLELDRLTPRTPEDFLFKGQAESLFRPESALQNLDEAIRRRDSLIARAVRLEVRANYALTTDDPEVAGRALEDAQVARAMLPGNPVVLASIVHAHLIAAGVFAEKGQFERCRAVLEQARRDAQALEPFASLRPAALARFEYFDYVGDEEAALVASRRAPKEYRYALMLYRRGQFEQALKAVEHTEGRRGMARVERAFILAELPDGPRRAGDLFSSAQADESRFGRLAAPMILLLLGRGPEAVQAYQTLRKDPTLVPPWFQGWYHRYLDYHCRTITGEQLLQAAGTCRPKLSEAHFAIGLHCLAEGDREGAKEHFRKCVAARVFFYWDYLWARAFLERLEEKDSTWPPWMPPKK
jgi:tetratricopeptide (TPR) repeat protein